MSIGEFRERLASSKLEPSVLSTCLAVTDILAQIRARDGQHLGLPFFYERLENPEHQRWLLPALSILSTRNEAILELHGYLDDKEHGQLHLTDDDFRDLMLTGLLAHPSTGKLVPNPMEHVRIFYSLTENAQREP